MQFRTALSAAFMIVIIVLASFSVYESFQLNDARNQNSSLSGQISTLSSNFNRLLAYFPNATQVKVPSASLTQSIDNKSSLITMSVANWGLVTLYGLRATLLLSSTLSFNVPLDVTSLQPHQVTFGLATLNASCRSGTNYVLEFNATTDFGTEYSSSTLIACTTVNSGISSLITVSSDEVVVFTPSATSPFSISSWRIEIGNSGISPVQLTYQLVVGGYLTAGNSVTISPGHTNSYSSCFQSIITNSTTFDSSLWITNESGRLVIQQYPVSVVPATQVPFSNQFSASAYLHTAYSTTFRQNLTDWAMTVTNSGQKPIEFLYATLLNGTQLAAFENLRCAGSEVQLSGLPSNYSQSLSRNQTANYTDILPPIVSGTYTMVVTAIYADHSEVTQTYSVQVSS